MEYYGILPKEARLQLLIEAEYPTIIELCQDDLFYDICNGKVLWERKLKNDFNLASNNPKEEYFKQYIRKLEKEYNQTLKDRGRIRRLIASEVQKLQEERREEIGKLAEKITDEYEDKIEKLKRNIREKNKYEEILENIEKIENLAFRLDPEFKYWKTDFPK